MSSLRPLDVRRLGRVAYSDALALQRSLVEERRAGRVPDLLLLGRVRRGQREVVHQIAERCHVLGDRTGLAPGAAVFAGIEGTRPLLCEIQALTAPTGYGTPRRAVVGWDSNRLAMVLAVLEARCGVSIGANDVYLNVAGGLRISEPAADLAVAAAVVSSLADQPVPPDMAVFGEIGLGGEVRPVSQREARLREAAKLGFRSALVPRGRAGTASAPRPADGIVVDEIEHLADLVARFQPADRPLKRPRREGGPGRGQE